jgi:hypothetical protein
MQRSTPTCFVNEPRFSILLERPSARVEHSRFEVCHHVDASAVSARYLNRSSDRFCGPASASVLCVAATCEQLRRG